MMKIFKNIMALAAVALLFGACDKDVLDINSDPFKGKTYSNALDAPIASFLSEQEDFSEYVSVLRYSGMFDALNQSTDGVKFTAFVPTNEAMAGFYQRQGVSGKEDLGAAYMRQFVLYHTVGTDSIPTEKFVTLTSVTNLKNDVLSVEIDGEHAGEAILNGEGRITQMGLTAFNGKVYVLSSAMKPLVETVYDRVAETGRSTIMAEAIREAGWQKRLSTQIDTTYNQDRERVITRYYFTVLNVSDATFAKAGINSFAQLKSVLQSNDHQGLSADSLLRAYVGYHILQNQYTTDEMGTVIGTDTVRIWSTSATNQVFTLSTDTLTTDLSKKYFFNGESTPVYFVPEQSNILSTNGYVHELDSWMPVWEPKQTTLLWDLADNPAIKSIVLSHEKSYQPADYTSTEEKDRIALASCFDYEMSQSGTKNTTYSDIDYATCTSKLKNANNNDRVVFNVGYMGRVNVTTPTIVRGKYKVELNFVYTTSQSFMRNQSDGNGGLLKIMFDDNDDQTVYTAPYTKVTSISQGVYTSTLFDEIEFTETSAHKFSFIVLDPAASTNKNFSLQFDCIKFIPIEE